jgi:hypothetical protein
MFQYEEMSDRWESENLGSPGHTRYEELPFYSSAGQKLIQNAPGQAPTVGQRFALALISLGMLMGMSTLLTILATSTKSPGWVAVPLLFVLTLFTVAVVSINVVFNRRSW